MVDEDTKQHVCEECGSDRVHTEPESQASCILVCRNCLHREVILF